MFSDLQNVTYFNSIKVQLKRTRAVQTGCCLVHFNSIKVQLKRFFDRQSENAKLFQFHKGTIKAPSVSSAKTFSGISIP